MGFLNDLCAVGLARNLFRHLRLIDEVMHHPGRAVEHGTFFDVADVYV